MLSVEYFLFIFSFLWFSLLGEERKPETSSSYKSFFNVCSYAKTVLWVHGYLYVSSGHVLVSQPFSFLENTKYITTVRTLRTVLSNYCLVVVVRTIVLLKKKIILFL